MLAKGAPVPNSVKTLAHMVFYPMVLVVCFIFGTINRIQSIFERPIYEIVILHAIFQSSQGTLNAIVYGTTPSVKSAFYGMFSSEMKGGVRMEEADNKNDEHQSYSDGGHVVV
eukprot:CAMPEP_0184481368 /NCGR_PEP_ID=MMETSP0113_2-20130426/2924_1 /TAXON_ID=91329 /ORGANISM="Norrisiella sphaerica, Strain BC52" /LENGTH=112 /DNA_ID=CAMNT_0026860465 /DNA_START=916 /DNA_END=1254 /DNA_ORIENTATION=-